MMTALFHHDSLLYLGLDCFTILLIDISNMNSSTFSALKPVVTLLFFSFLVYLVYFLMLYSIKRTESSSAREERNERFYGLYHYAIISLPLLPVYASNPLLFVDPEFIPQHHENCSVNYIFH